MPPRFYVPGLAESDTPVALSDDEARHLTRVLRLGAGDTVSVFDGRGVEFLARVEQVTTGRVVVRPYQSVAPAPEPAVALTVAQALLKGRTFDDVVRDVTMVGAVAVQPLLTERTEARVRNIGRWTRIAIASAKQCRRAVVPEVRAPQPFRALLDDDRSQLRLLLVEPGTAGAPGALRALEQASPPATAVLAVGPEGGWSAEEVATATAAGFVPVTLGRRTLRADAVVVCAVSVLQYIWGDM
ncbi:MAG: RsmE family RNA methyltransferase [Vicinamibacterales bacterium]|jgi:16S rRNA (uracil1498-N3)-methyltransferase|nr:RsmE family RNA methyltransferase [Vicinamibacterales bacterium]